MTAYAEVIGDPIAQSKSPLIHRFWLDALGIAADYRARQVTRADFAGWLAAARVDGDWRGANVTMPLKLDALLAADSATDPAIAAGAANILLPRDGKILADNSDVSAIRFLLGKLKSAGKPIDSVTLFGTGGAARAALATFREVGVKHIVIQARDMGAAKALAVEFEADEIRPLIAPVAGHGLVNATPLGMEGRECLNCDLGQLASDGWVFDMVSTPVDTPLVREARARGLTAITGLDMLIEQAATSFRLFFDADPPRDRDAELRHKLSA